MNISDISYANIGLLYNVIASKMNNPSIKGDFFKSKFIDFLNLIHINIKVNNITSTDYLTLLKFGTRVYNVTNYTKCTDFFDVNFKNSIFSQTITNLRTKCLPSGITTESEHKITDVCEHYLPACSEVFDCDVEFFGSSLVNIVTLDPEKFFVDISDGMCIVNGEFDINWWNNLYNSKNTVSNPDKIKKVNEKIKEIILKKYFEFAIKLFTSDDKMTEDAFSTRYKKYFDNNRRVIPEGFYNNGLYYNIYMFHSPEMNTDITAIRNANINQSSNVIQKETYIQFVCKTPLDVYVIFKNIFPKNAFIFEESYNVFNKYLSANKNPPGDYDLAIAKKYYGSKSSSIFLELVNTIKSLTKKYSNNILEQMYLTNNASEITFVLHLSLSDINTYAVKLNDDVSKTYKGIIYMNIINQIIAYAKTIYSSIITKK